MPIFNKARRGCSIKIIDKTVFINANKVGGRTLINEYIAVAVSLTAVSKAINVNRLSSRNK